MLQRPQPIAERAHKFFKSYSLWFRSKLAYSLDAAACVFQTLHFSWMTRVQPFPLVLGQLDDGSGKMEMLLERASAPASGLWGPSSRCLPVGLNASQLQCDFGGCSGHSP